jgi:hypothetical protein
VDVLLDLAARVLDHRPERLERLRDELHDVEVLAVVLERRRLDLLLRVDHVRAERDVVARLLRRQPARAEVDRVERMRHAAGRLVPGRDAHRGAGDRDDVRVGDDAAAAMDDLGPDHDARGALLIGVGRDGLATARNRSNTRREQDAAEPGLHR